MRTARQKSCDSYCLNTCKIEEVEEIVSICLMFSETFLLPALFFRMCFIRRVKKSLRCALAAGPAWETE